MSFGHTGVILDAGEGKTVSALGNSYTYKASGKETEGRYAPSSRPRSWATVLHPTFTRLRKRLSMF
jgi:hypothetical protein